MYVAFGQDNDRPPPGGPGGELRKSGETRRVLRNSEIPEFASFAKVRIFDGGGKTT